MTRFQDYPRFLLPHKNNWHIFLLLLIFLIAGFLRFYNTPLRYGFDQDAVRDAFVSLEGAKELQFPVVGPFSSRGSFTFGPWYYYQLIIFKLIAPFDYAPWIYIGIISLAYIFILYKIGILLENKMYGLILAGLAAIAPGQIIPATGLSNPNLISIHAVLCLWIFLKLIQKKLSYWWSILLGISLGIGINNHYQMIGLLILPIILFIYKKEKRYVHLLGTCLGLFVSFLPLLFFNVTHHWHTLKGLLYYYTVGIKDVYVPNSWILYVRNFWPSFWSFILGVPNQIGLLIILLSMIIFIRLARAKKLSISFLFILLIFGLQFVFLRYYSGERNFYYFYYLDPFVFLFTGYLLFNMAKLKYGAAISIICSIILIIFIMKTDAVQLNPTQSHVESKSQAEALIYQHPDKKFQLYACKKTYVHTEAVVFLLNNTKKLDTNGMRIGFTKGDCNYPNITSKIILAENVNEKYDYFYGITVVDLTDVNDIALYNAGWALVTPKTVYDNATRWWVKDKL